MRHMPVIKMSPSLGPRSAVPFFGIGIDTNRNLAQILVKKSLAGKSRMVFARAVMLVTQRTGQRRMFMGGLWS